MHAQHTHDGDGLFKYIGFAVHYASLSVLIQICLKFVSNAEILFVLVEFTSYLLGAAWRKESGELKRFIIWQGSSIL